MNENVVEAEFKDVPATETVQAAIKKFNFICILASGGGLKISLNGSENETHVDLLRKIICTPGGMIFNDELYPIKDAKDIVKITADKEVT